MSRLHKALTVVCVGRLLDHLTTQYGLTRGFTEGNPYFDAGLGFPLLVLSLIAYDHIFPVHKLYTMWLYSISIMMWFAVVNNVWVLTGHEMLPAPLSMCALLVGSFVFLFFKDRFLKGIRIEFNTDVI